jgi:hypothetical protein
MIMSNNPAILMMVAMFFASGTFVSVTGSMRMSNNPTVGQGVGVGMGMVAIAASLD